MDKIAASTFGGSANSNGRIGSGTDGVWWWQRPGFFPSNSRNPLDLGGKAALSTHRIAITMNTNLADAYLAVLALLSAISLLLLALARLSW